MIRVRYRWLIEGRRVHEHFREEEVIRLARGDRWRQRDAPIEEVWAERNVTPSMVSKFPSAVTLSPTLRGAKRRESAAGVLRDRPVRLVSGHRTSPVPSAAAWAVPAPSAGIPGMSVVGERPRNRAREAVRVAVGEGVRVVVGVEGEARVGAAVDGGAPRGAPEPLLDGVAAGGIVEADDDAGVVHAGLTAQPEVAVVVVDEGDHTGDALLPLLDQHVPGDDVADVGPVGADGGEPSRRRSVLHASALASPVSPLATQAAGACSKSCVRVRRLAGRSRRRLRGRMTICPPTTIDPPE